MVRPVSAAWPPPAMPRPIAGAGRPRSARWSPNIAGSWCWPVCSSTGRSGRAAVGQGVPERGQLRQVRPRGGDQVQLPGEAHAAAASTTWQKPSASRRRSQRGTAWARAARPRAARRAGSAARLRQGRGQGGGIARRGGDAAGAVALPGSSRAARPAQVGDHRQAGGEVVHQLVRRGPFGEGRRPAPGIAGRSGCRPAARPGAAWAAGRGSGGCRAPPPRRAARSRGFSRALADQQQLQPGARRPAAAAPLAAAGRAHWPGHAPRHRPRGPPPARRRAGRQGGTCGPNRSRSLPFGSTCSRAAAPRHARGRSPPCPPTAATTAAARRQAASASRSIARHSSGEPRPMARGSSGQGSRISKTKGRRAQPAGGQRRQRDAERGGAGDQQVPAAVQRQAGGVGGIAEEGGGARRRAPGGCRRGWRIRPRGRRRPAPRAGRRGSRRPAR